jgi:hypothetical protein
MIAAGSTSPSFLALIWMWKLLKNFETSFKCELNNPLRVSGTPVPHYKKEADGGGRAERYELFNE